MKIQKRTWLLTVSIALLALLVLALWIYPTLVLERRSQEVSQNLITALDADPDIFVAGYSPDSKKHHYPNIIHLHVQCGNRGKTRLWVQKLNGCLPKFLRLQSSFCAQRDHTIKVHIATELAPEELAKIQTMVLANNTYQNVRVELEQTHKQEPMLEAVLNAVDPNQVTTTKHPPVFYPRRSRRRFYYPPSGNK